MRASSLMLSVILFFIISLLFFIIYSSPTPAGPARIYPVVPSTSTSSDPFELICTHSISISKVLTSPVRLALLLSPTGTSIMFSYFCSYNYACSLYPDKLFRSLTHCRHSCKRSAISAPFPPQTFSSDRSTHQHRPYEPFRPRAQDALFAPRVNGVRSLFFLYICAGAVRRPV